MTEERGRKIEQKQTDSDAILGTRKLFPPSLPLAALGLDNWLYIIANFIIILVVGYYIKVVYEKKLYIQFHIFIYYLPSTKTKPENEVARNLP